VIDNASRADDGIAEMQQGWADSRALGVKLAATHATFVLADACVQAGRTAPRLDWVKVAREHARIFHKRLFEAEIHKVHGELLLGTAVHTENFIRAGLSSGIG